jgi:dTDP-glucose pyrophosphorylase
MKKKGSTLAIIPAAGIPTNKLNINSNTPDTMLPINGKPVIGHILDDLLARKIYRAIIVLNEQDHYTEKYVEKKYASKIKLTVVRNTLYGRGVGYSIYLGCREVTDAELETGILVYLGDTIYKGGLDFNQDFLVINSSLTNSQKWCYVEESPSGLAYINKPTTYTGNGKPLAGIYYFSNKEKLIQSVNTVVAQEPIVELHRILTAYGSHFTLVPAQQHYDCGNIENYYQARIDFLRTRSFNTLEYNDLFGTITKSGTNRQKLEDEINWFKNVPHELQIFTPRLIDYTISQAKVSYSLEYYGYQSLADYYVLNQFDQKVWQVLIDRLFTILSLFKKYSTPLPYRAFHEMYIEKVEARIKVLEQDSMWKDLLAQETLTINDIEYPGWPSFASKISSFADYLYTSSTPSFIHGDMCLSNILFDPHTLLVKLIDPRGRFGDHTIYGDHNYDLAKLRHSFVGQYDFIISDLFILIEQENSFQFQILCDQDHLEIGALFDDTLQNKGYNSTAVTLIEALLFLSMIPLHNEAPLRQKAMFLTGIKLLKSIHI